MDYRYLGSIFRGPLTGVTIGCYPTAGSLSAGFVYDDRAAVVENADLLPASAPGGRPWVRTYPGAVHIMRGLRTAVQ